MTIHHDWIGLFKTWVPVAFSRDAPTNLEAGFIDGQIKLMGLPRPAENTRPTWEIFLQAQFIRPIERLWRQGAPTVILAFDDYSLVPKAKSITQAARRARLTPIEFEETDSLPDFPPDPWAPAMVNRIFKAKVQQLVIEALPRLLEAKEGSVLIVDWKGPVVSKIEWMPCGTIKVSEMPREPVGEADIKFARWAKQLNVPMGAEATDGDFVPIALMSTARNLWVLRNEANPTKTDPLKHHEWVNVDLLRKGLIDCMGYKQQTILPMIALIAITGTDFSRGLPYVGPRRLVKILGIFSTTRRALGEGGCIDPEPTLDSLVSLIYASLYRAHVDEGPFKDVICRLTTTPSLSKRLREKLPSESQALTTLRNANFLFKYWAADEPEAPDSMIKGLYGFRMGERGKVEWDDDTSD